jgi:hypothetical protein
LRLAGELRKLLELAEYFVGEIQTKRCVCKRILYHFLPEYAYLEKPQRKILCTGHANWNGMNEFPGAFKDVLDSATCRDAPGVLSLEKHFFDFMDVYYGADRAEFAETRRLNKDDWTLGACE